MLQGPLQGRVRNEWPAGHMSQRAIVQSLSGPANETTYLDGSTDRTQLRTDLATEKDEGDDRDDSDERENEGIFGQTLAIFVGAE